MPRIGEPFNPYNRYVGSFTPNCIMECKDLSSTAKLVYGRLLQHKGDAGSAYPSYSTLGKEVGIGRRACIAVITELESKGFIKRIRRGNQATTVFEIIYHKVYDGAQLRTGERDCTSEKSCTSESNCLTSERDCTRVVHETSPNKNHVKESIKESGDTPTPPKKPNVNHHPGNPALQELTTYFKAKLQAKNGTGAGVTFATCKDLWADALDDDDVATIKRVIDHYFTLDRKHNFNFFRADYSDLRGEVMNVQQKSAQKNQQNSRVKETTDFLDSIRREDELTKLIMAEQGVHATVARRLARERLEAGHAVA